MAWKETLYLQLQYRVPCKETLGPAAQDSPGKILHTVLSSGPPVLGLESPWQEFRKVLHDSLKHLHLGKMLFFQINHLSWQHSFPSKWRASSEVKYELIQKRKPIEQWYKQKPEADPYRFSDSCSCSPRASAALPCPPWAIILWFWHKTTT